MSEAKKTILVVDDDPEIVESTRVALESAGYAVVAARSAKEALQRLEEQKPDLIILDVMMSRLSEGFDLSFDIRCNPAWSNVPILVVTGIGKKFGINLAEERAGEFVQADDFLEKPVDPAVLLERVARLLRRGRK